MASWLSGVALSTTSVAVVYTVMMEAGLTRTVFGQMILTACFITDLATVIALGLIFAPFTLKNPGFCCGRRGRLRNSSLAGTPRLQAVGGQTFRI